MTFDQLKKKAESLQVFARLHGWCSQTEDRIKEYSQDCQKMTGSDKKVLEKGLLKDLKSAVSSEEKIIIILMTVKLGSDVRLISDQCFLFLKGLLNQHDYLFIVQIIFKGRYPVPMDIAYNISQRTFLSYRRAIYYALHIESFESNLHPDYCVLFFVCLVCRRDLNKQNEAILYFLLSRIDTDLPENLADKVYEYVNALQDIIEDVELRQEESLSDSLDYGDEQELLEKKISPEAAVSLGSEDVNYRDQLLVKEQSVQQKKAESLFKKDKLKKPKLTQTIQELDFSNADFKQDKKFSTLDRKKQPLVQKLKSFIIDKFPLNRNKEEQGIKSKTAEYSPVPEQIFSKIDSKKNLASDLPIVAESGKSETVVNTEKFTISFTRSSESLKKIMDKLKGSKTTGKIQSDIKSLKSVNLFKTFLNFLNRLQRKRLKLLIAALSSAILLIFMIPLFSDNEKDTPVFEMNNQLPFDLPDTQSSAEDNLINETSTEGSEESQKIQENQPPESPLEIKPEEIEASFSFIITPDRILWKPSPGDSISRLFYYLNNDLEQRRDIFGSLDLLEWGSFLLYILGKNAPIIDPHLIYTDVSLVIYQIE